MTTSIKAFAFDAFGTLVTPVGRFGPYQKLAARAGCDPRSFRIDAMTGDVPLEEMAVRLGCGDMAEELAAALRAELATVKLYPEVMECLSLLQNEGIPYAVCSNLGHGYGSRVRELVPGASGFLMSYEIGAFKPDPRIYASVVSALDVPAKGIWFVGDTRAADYDGPIRFGMRASHLDRRSGDDLLSVIRRALRDASDDRILDR